MIDALALLRTAEGWGRAVAGFRRHYGLDLRTALAELPWQDVAALCEHMPAQWGPAEENVAMLVDRLDFLLNGEYAGWTTDTSDPELAAERDRRRAAGVEPPPFPLLRPVARRPAELHEKLLADYERAQEHFANPPRQKASLADVISLFGNPRIVGGE